MGCGVRSEALSGSRVSPNGAFLVGVRMVLGASSCSSQPATPESAPSSGSLIQISRWGCWGCKAGPGPVEGTLLGGLGVGSPVMLRTSPVLPILR